MTEHPMGEQVEPLDIEDPSVADFAADLRHPGAVSHEQRAERHTYTAVVEGPDGEPAGVINRTVDMVSGSNYFAPTGRGWEADELTDHTTHEDGGQDEGIDEH